MNSEAIIMLALATGAAARTHPNSLALERPEVAAYQKLLDLLTRAYPGVDAHLLEIGPGSDDRQNHLKEQIRQSGAAVDPEVLRESRRVLQEIVTHAPRAAVAIFSDTATTSSALLEVENYLEVAQDGRKEQSRSASSASRPAATAAST